GQRNVNGASIPAGANSIVMVDALSPLNARKNSGLLVAPVRWNNQEYRLAHDFFCCIAVESLCTLVPCGHDAVELDAGDCITTGFHNGSEPTRSLLTLAQCSFGFVPFNKVGCLSRKYIQ